MQMEKGTQRIGQVCGLITVGWEPASFPQQGNWVGMMLLGGGNASFTARQQAGISSPAVTRLLARRGSTRQ